MTSSASLATANPRAAGPGGLGPAPHWRCRATASTICSAEFSGLRDSAAALSSTCPRALCSARPGRCGALSSGDLAWAGSTADVFCTARLPVHVVPASLRCSADDRTRPSISGARPRNCSAEALSTEYMVPRRTSMLGWHATVHRLPDAVLPPVDLRAARQPLALRFSLPLRQRRRWRRPRCFASVQLSAEAAGSDECRAAAVRTNTAGCPSHPDPPRVDVSSCPVLGRKRRRRQPRMRRRGRLYCSA